jgi:hypothetical protein
MEVVSCYYFRPDPSHVIIKFNTSGAKVITILVVFYRLPLKVKGFPEESLSARFDLLHC